MRSKLTVKSIAKVLWNSPTFTTWGNHATESLRLLAVTPLILTQFNTTEIAAWYLFGSLMLFGTLINQRISLTFSRMIAFAMGGAIDLAPIRDLKTNRGDGKPNWALVERAYLTIGGLNMLLAVATMLAALALGYLGLEKIVAEYDRPGEIWLAFAVILGSQTLLFTFRKYYVALKGMNYVALSNRWEVVFSLLSVGMGFIVLSAGANIVGLAIGMQSVVLLNVLRMKCLLNYVEEGRYKAFKAAGIDWDVIRWAWQPFWKGMTVALANNGVLQLASVLYARHAPVEAVGAYLFAIRLLQAANNISTAPFSSHVPKMARLMAEGNVPKLRKMVQQRTLMAQGLLALAILLLGIIAEPILRGIGANIPFLPPIHFFLLSSMLLIQRYLVMAISVSAVGNHVICFKQEVLATIVSVALLIVLIPVWGLFGVIIGAFLPQILILNVVPIQIAARRINVSVQQFFWNTTGVVLSVYLILVSVYISLI